MNPLLGKAQYVLVTETTHQDCTFLMNIHLHFHESVGQPSRETVPQFHSSVYFVKILHYRRVQEMVS